MSDPLIELELDKVPSVFISYAHDNESHKAKVLELANKLTMEGLDCWIDRYVEGSNPPERGWPQWMEEKIRLSDYVLVVPSPKYKARFEGTEKAGVGKGGKYESILILTQLYENETINKKFYSVVVNNGDEKNIIAPLLPFTRYNVTTANGYDILYGLLTNQSEIVRPKVGKIRKLYTKNDNESKTDFNSTELLHLRQLPEVPNFLADMNQNTKILQAFFSIPLTKRFQIARELGVVIDGENMENKPDELSAQFLIRAKDRNLLADLWSKLFDENIDPNPFKNLK
ncbi:MAG: TIR domain-containing protein [Bacteroidia bacterium]